MIHDPPEESRTAPIPKAMLIDLDDTIIHYPGQEECWRQVCAEAAGQITGLDAGHLFREITRTRYWYWSDPERHRIGRLDLNAASVGIVRRALRTLGFDLPDLARDAGLSYRARRNAGAELIPGAVDALRRLRRGGIRLAMITNGNGEGQRAKVERFDLARHFDQVFIEGEIGYGKPDRRVYLGAMAALGSEPGEAWCVGDNLEWEVAAPQRLGIFCVWVDPTGEGRPADPSVTPDRIVTSIAELGFHEAADR